MTPLQPRPAALLRVSAATGGPPGAQLHLVDVDRLWDRLDGLGALSDAEIGRMVGHDSATSRRRFAARRIALRRILGDLLATPPAAVPLEVTSLGAPRLAAGSGLSFSVSHCERWSAFAIIGGSTPVGVDLERTRPHLPCRRLAGRYFDRRESDALAALPSSLVPAAFLRCWVCKEALLKAAGVGLTASLRDVAVDADPRRPPRALQVLDDDPAQWSLVEMPLGQGLRVAVAARLCGESPRDRSRPSL